MLGIYLEAPVLRPGILLCRYGLILDPFPVEVLLMGYALETRRESFVALYHHFWLCVVEALNITTPPQRVGIMITLGT